MRKRHMLKRVEEVEDEEAENVEGEWSEMEGRRVI